MLNQPFNSGSCVAASTYGLEKTAWRAQALGTLAGAGIGYAMARPEEKTQGSILGALGGFGLSGGFRRRPGLPGGRGTSPVAPPTGTGTLPALGAAPKAAPPPPNAGAQTDPRFLLGSGPQAAPPPASGAGPRAAPPPRGSRGAVSPETVDWLRGVSTKAEAKQRFREQAMKHHPDRGGNEATMQSINDMWSRVQQHPGFQKMAWQHGTLGALEGFGVKVADYGVGLSIPGTPIGISGSGKDVRYEGMRRFVPRATFERAYEGLDQGLDPQALLELEQNQGTIRHPLMGLAAGAFAGRKLFPNGGIPAMVLGGLAGGGAGALYNAATADGRVADMHEAIRGVLSEQNNIQSAITGQPAMTANESTPLLVSRGEVG